MMKVTRRDILKILTNFILTLSGLLGLRGIIKFLAYQTEEEPPSSFDLGSTMDFPVGSAIVREEIPAIIYHRDDGFDAMSLVCTHLGCTLRQEGDGFACPCHGSRFDENGQVLRGPAEKALGRLQVEVNEDGELVLHVGEL